MKCRGPEPATVGPRMGRCIHAGYQHERVIHNVWANIPRPGKQALPTTSGACTVDDNDLLCVTH